MNRVVHFEITAEDPKRACEFYDQVFGWKTQTWDGPQGYWLLTTGPKSEPGIDGGVMGKHFPQPVINTVQVESLEATLEKVRAAGGKLAHGPNEIPGVGRHAYCSDPEGTLFGIMEPLERASA